MGLDEVGISFITMYNYTRKGIFVVANLGLTQAYIYYGFKKLSADITSAYLWYTIYPVCLNGSSLVEIFFSEVKHATSG